MRACVCVCLHARRRLRTFVRAQKIEMKEAFQLPRVGVQCAAEYKSGNCLQQALVLPYVSFGSYLYVALFVHSMFGNRTLCCYA